MSEYTVNNKRVARNTFLLYVRMILVTLLNLYIVRVVLEVLGVEDYGIYNVVAGMVASLSFVTGVLSSATQRFYSFVIGEAYPDKLKSVFNVSMTCYLCFALIVIILGETIGVWIIKTQLKIPGARMEAALLAYQFSIFSFVLTMVQVPFSSLTIAKEDMNIWSILSIAETALKLIFALLLPCIAIDYLISYGASLFFIWLITFVSYVVICRVNYPETCRFNLKFYDRNLFREMISFSGWTTYGALAGVGLNQGITILINVFFGPVVNTARAIGLQISNAIVQFCNSFITAVSPPVVKCYATNNTSKIIQLFYLTNKVLYYSALVICLPLILEMDFVLNIWLKNTSDMMVIFAEYSVIFAILMALHNPVTIIIEAAGDVRNYRVCVESITLLAMPLTWVVYKFGAPPVSTYIVILTVFVIAHVIRVKMLSHKIPEITLWQYFRKFVISAILVTIVAYLVLFTIKGVLPCGFIRFSILLFVSVVVIAILTFILALSKQERNLFINLLRNSRKIF